MKKKVALLLITYILFYSLIHLSRHLPELAKGNFDLGGEKTLPESILRNSADMIIGFLFTLLPYLVLCKYYPSKRFIPIILLMTFSISGTFIISFVWNDFMEDGQARLGNYFAFSIFFYAVNVIFGFVFYFVRYAHYKELQEKELAVQSRNSELSFLRSQINPHFLFNNLNNIYSLVSYKSDRALNAISGLSELLRYMLYNTNETVLLNTELSYIEKYITLQVLRFEVPEEINVEVTGDTDGIYIPPLILIPFVENAFKHGDSATADWLDIALSVDQDHIIFSCSNKKAIKHKDPKGGIGIENVKRRLELLYPENHRLEIREDNEWYNIRLTLSYGK